MIDLIVLILAATALGYFVQNRMQSAPSAKIGISRDIISKPVYFAIIVAFALFAGLRSKYNDTSTYMYGFRLVDASVLDIGGIFDSYGGFELYERLLKRFVSDDPQVFIFVTSWLIVLLYLPFFTRHTQKFGGMIFFFGIGVFVSSMGGIKQSIAVGISLYAIAAYFDKKYFRALLLLWLASTFHPYIWCLICLPLLTKRVWDGKTVLVIVVCVLAFLNLDSLFDLLGILGKDYSDTTLDDYTINPIRVAVEAIPVVLSLIYRKEINAKKSRYLTLGLNMRVISFAFVCMGLFMNPIYFGRMSSYFSAMATIAIPEMLDVIWSDKRQGKLLTFGYYAFFFVYFLMDMTKIGSIAITYDQFNHVSLFSIFS